LTAKIWLCGMALRNAHALSKGHRPKVQNLTPGCGPQVVTFCLCPCIEERWGVAEWGLGLSNQALERCCFGLPIPPLSRSSRGTWMIFPSLVSCQPPWRSGRESGNMMTRINSFSPTSDNFGDKKKLQNGKMTLVGQECAEL